MAGGMSALTLILVAVLKNSELRTERALHTKLDAIASSMLEERRGHEGDAEEQLERSIGVHDEIWTRAPRSGRASSVSPRSGT